MICAYILRDGNHCEKAEGLDAVLEAHQQGNARFWVNAEGASETELNRLGAAFGLAPAAIDDCLTGEQRPRTDEYDDYLFLLCYGVLGRNEHPVYTPRKVGIFYGRDFLITAHNEPLLGIDTAWQNCGRLSCRTLKRGLDHMLFHVLDAIVDNYVILAEHLEDQLEDLESRSLSEVGNAEILTQLSDIRGDLIEFRRTIQSMRELLLPFAQGAYAEVSPDLERQFRHVLDHMLIAYELADSLRDLMQAIRDNYHTQLADRTNDLMRLLTIFAATMMPPTLLAGVYGMNMRLWPGMDTLYTFWGVLGIMAALIAGMLAFFRWRRWL